MADVKNPALEESTDPDDASSQPAPPPRVEVTDAAALSHVVQHVRVGRHFVFVDDAQAVMPPSGRMQRLVGYKQKKGRLVKALADVPVEIAGARIHPAALDVSPLASLTCDRDVYRAERDVVHLAVALPGLASCAPGSTSAPAPAPPRVQIRVAMNGAPLTERDVDVSGSGGIAQASLAMLLPGQYEARLVVDGRELAEPTRFTVAEYALAPLSARLLEHRLDRAAQTLSATFAVESYALPFDRPLRAMLVERGREMSEISLSMSAPGRFSGKARIVGDGPFRVRLTAVDDAARIAEVALPGTRRAERQLTLAGELGKELYVSLLPEPSALSVRGLFVTHGDFIATPIVVENPICNERAILRANEDVESLVVAAFDPARHTWSVHEAGNLQRNAVAEIEVPRPFAIAFVGCFVKGEPFEAFTSLFAAERPVSLGVPDVVAPKGEIAIQVRTGRSHAIPMLVCVRDERLTATDAPLTALASSTKRALTRAAAGLGDDFKFARLGEIVTPAQLAPPAATRALRAPAPKRAADGGWWVRVSERNVDGAREERCTRNEITLGRNPANDVVLKRPNVSKRHARIVLRDGIFIIADLHSTNGTYVNGRKISAPHVLVDGDRVYIGDFTLEIVPAPDQTVYLGARAAAASPAVARRPALAQSAPDDDGIDASELLSASDGADDLFDDEAPPARAARAASAADDLLGDNDLLGDDGESAKNVDMEPHGYGPAGASLPAKRDGRGDDGAVAHEEAAVRATFPEILLCAIVEVADGDTIRVPAGEQLGAYAVEAFFVDGGDFGATRARVQIDQRVRVDLDIAPEIDPDDRVQGTLRAFVRDASSTTSATLAANATKNAGGVRVSLVRDGRAVPLRTVDGRIVAAGDVLPSGVELSFDAGPGVWLATAEDAATGVIDAMEVRVGAPGVYRTVAREIVLLDKGKKLRLDGDDASVLSLRVLPGIDAPFAQLAEATAGYEHLCCEQTAAKILSAAVMMLTVDDRALRARAEDVIVAGIARERTMHKQGRGFAIYPNQSQISEHYTPLVVRHLWSLDGVAELGGISAQLRDAVRAGLAMADDAAHAFALRRIPERAESLDDAHAIAVREPRRMREALELVAKNVIVDEAGARLRSPSSSSPSSSTHRVAERASLAYAAAVLFAAGKAQTAMRVANEVLRELNAQGRLYSTVDSVAAIALMVQLKRSGLAGAAGARITVNGASTTAERAASMSDQVEAIEVNDGVCVVEVSRLREERWADARSSSSMPLKVGFHDANDRSVARFKKGDRAELVVTLPKGYVEGDLLHVCLPPAMAWIEGGARVKRFTVDFAGRDVVRVPVVVTHAIQGRQRFAVAVRNMFEEERAAAPGLLAIDGA